MAVKLLNKSEMANLKAKETSREIQEGVKLATRVDNLRQLQAKTEQEFETYKVSTLQAIQEEIQKALEEKDKITGALRQLRKEYETLLPEIPLKRKELADFEKKLFSWEKRLEKKEEKTNLEEIDVAEARQKADFARVRNEDNERTTRNLLIQASKKKQEAQNELDTARTIHDKAVNDQKDIEASLILREYGIKSKEQELLTQQMNLASDRKLLSIEKIKVEDMRQTLQRSLERIKQGRLA
jgi:hypothetical protein